MHLSFDEKAPSPMVTDIPYPMTGEEPNATEVNETHRGLKSRHVQLIALGGCIGTGLFVGSGTILARSGPGSLFVAYCIMSFVIWSVMNALGEMTTYLPIRGASPTMFVHRFSDESAAFATGWNYW